MNTNPNSQVNPEDFSPAEHAAVDAMAAPIIEEQAREAKFTKRFLGRRNRSATKRMNRPEKTDKMEVGALLHLNLIDKGLKLNPIREENTKELSASEEASET